MRYLILNILIVFVLSSCSINIESIEYGSDACDFCRMSIVDKTHAAQVVTSKGKNYKFDATECMINYLHEHQNEDGMAHILSANILQPGTMIDVKSATFLISENIPSPMGANLSAIADKQEAIDLQTEKGGKLYSWEQVKKVIKDTPIYNHGDSEEHAHH